MRGGTVGEVIESKSETLKVGDIVSGSVGWQQYALVTDKEVHKVTLPEGVTPADQVSMQLTGLTAMVGIYKIGAAKFAPGTTVLVSGAAGSTGSFAGQIYKNALGCRVVGTAGGAEKCKYAKEVLGFDDCIDCGCRNMFSGGTVY
jgi:NADPH-dependent curcumin reductase CurA